MQNCDKWVNTNKILTYVASKIKYWTTMNKKAVRIHMLKKKKQEIKMGDVYTKYS